MTKDETTEAGVKKLSELSLPKKVEDLLYGVDLLKKGIFLCVIMFGSKKDKDWTRDEDGKALCQIPGCRKSYTFSSQDTGQSTAVVSHLRSQHGFTYADYKVVYARKRTQKVGKSTLSTLMHLSVAKNASTDVITNSRHFFEWMLEENVRCTALANPKWQAIRACKDGHHIPVCVSKEQVRSYLIVVGQLIMHDELKSIETKQGTLCLDGGKTTAKQLAFTFVERDENGHSVSTPVAIFPKPSDKHEAIANTTRAVLDMLQELKNPPIVQAICSDGHCSTAKAVRIVCKERHMTPLICTVHGLQLEMPYLLQSPTISTAVTWCRGQKAWRAPNETRWWSVCGSVYQVLRSLPPVTDLSAEDAESINPVIKAKDHLVSVRVHGRLLESDGCTIWSAWRLLFRLMNDADLHDISPMFETGLRNRSMCKFINIRTIVLFLMHPHFNFNDLPREHRNAVTKAGKYGRKVINELVTLYAKAENKTFAVAEASKQLIQSAWEDWVSMKHRHTFDDEDEAAEFKDLPPIDAWQYYRQHNKYQYLAPIGELVGHMCWNEASVERVFSVIGAAVPKAANRTSDALLIARVAARTRKSKACGEKRKRRVQQVTNRLKNNQPILPEKRKKNEEPPAPVDEVQSISDSEAYEEQLQEADAPAAPPVIDVDAMSSASDNDDDEISLGDAEETREVVDAATERQVERTLCTSTLESYCFSVDFFRKKKAKKRG